MKDTNDTKKRTKPTNVLLKPEYKTKLTKAAHMLSLEYDERVTIVSIIYRLIDNHFDDAIKSIREDLETNIKKTT